jgi:hypothetical protein
MSGIRKFDFYDGQLDAATNDELKKLIKDLKAQFPLVLVGYVDGEDTEDAVTGKSAGSQLYFRHDCTFIVFCLANNPRGVAARKRPQAAHDTGTIKMISQARYLLAGKQFLRHPSTGVISVVTPKPTSAVWDSPITDPREEICGPLIPKSVPHVAKLDGLSCQAQIFETYFRWSTETETAAAVGVEEININVELFNTGEQTKPEPKPGVLVW